MAIIRHGALKRALDRVGKKLALLARQWIGIEKAEFAPRPEIAISLSNLKDLQGVMPDNPCGHGLKIFGSEKILDPKNFGSEKFLGSTYLLCSWIILHHHALS